MKLLHSISKTTKHYVATAAFFLFQSFLWAQEKKEVDVNLSVDDGTQTDRFGQPWLWVVGGAVFIIIIVAIIRGGGSKD
jgi:hypothetical protein